MDLTNIGGFNTMINNLTDKLIKDITNSGLPIGISYYILKDILRNVEQQYNITLIEEEKNIKCSQQQVEELDSKEN